MTSKEVLAALGFMALATTSSGFAFTLGRTDGSFASLAAPPTYASGSTIEAENAPAVAYGA